MLNRSAVDDLLDELLPLSVDDIYPPSDWWSGQARPNQLPPPGEWRTWLILAGRGFGKTRTTIEWANEQARTQPGSRGALIGATASDARDILVLGESGILAKAHPDFRPIYNPSKRLLTYPNGSMALIFSADEPDRLRGVQHHWGICDELASWRYPESWDMFLLGLRLGNDPRAVIATTPRPTKLIRSLLKDETCVVTRGNTYENRANLAPAFIDTIIRRYEGTRLGRQEIEGLILDTVEGALWQMESIDNARVKEAPELTRIVVAIDPAVTANEDSDETGIIVAGTARIDGTLHGFILDDLTLKGSPDEWARAAIRAYRNWRADRVIAETNNGGDMIEYTIRTVDQNIAFSQVRASRGKQTRAEPIAALYEQGRVHHVSVFPELEDQMCQWIPGDKSPDRVDAMVWALTELMLEDSNLNVGDAPEFLTGWRG